MEDEFEGSERHPFRFLFKLAVLAGLVYVAGRFFTQKKREFAGLTESEAHDKLIGKIAPKFGDEAANEIAGQVIPKLKEKGFIKPDPIDEGSPDEKAGPASDEKEEAADTVAND